MNLDTGSSDIWVPSVNCGSPALCSEFSSLGEWFKRDWKYDKNNKINNILTESINKYDAAASSSHKQADGAPTFGLGYAVGGLSGLRAVETVSVI